MRRPQLHHALSAFVLVVNLALLSPTAAWASLFVQQTEGAPAKAQSLSPARWLQALLAVWQASSGLNPNGGSPTTDNGSGLAPNGSQSTGDIGSGLDPHG